MAQPGCSPPRSWTGGRDSPPAPVACAPTRRSQASRLQRRSGAASSFALVPCVSFKPHCPRQEYCSKNSTTQALRSLRFDAGIWALGASLASARSSETRCVRSPCNKPSMDPSRQHLRFFRIGHPLAVGIALKPFRDARREFRARVGGRRSDGLRDGASGQMLQRELSNARQVDIDPINAHLHIGKPCFRREALQVLFGRDLPRRAEARTSLGRYELSKRVAGGLMISADALPYAERETAAAVEHAAHFPQRARFIGKELQALLTQNCFEARILQSKVERAALKPFDRSAVGSRKRARDGDHSRIQVDADHPPGGTDPLRRNSCHDPCPASHVQHALASGQPRGVDQRGCTRTEDVSSAAARVALGGLAAELELLARAQRFSPCPRPCPR